MLSNETGGFIFQSLGVLAIVLFIWTLYRQTQIARWPTTLGEILESFVEKDADNNNVPRIRYQYSVRASTYESDRIYPHGIVATSGGYAERLVGRYPSGKPVRVRYNPNRPSDCALETRLPVWVPVLQLSAGVIFIIMGAYFKHL
ncbi:MAG: DUF3592 domain-containing protein [Gammaproteobacteria bacterium]|nr:DUF3592 domain-containing protein [Gammaproteobacteria bacterium]